MKRAVKKAFVTLGFKPSNAITLSDVRGRYKDMMLENMPRNASHHISANSNTQPIKDAKNILENYLQKGWEMPAAPQPHKAKPAARRHKTQKSGSMFFEYASLYTSYIIAFIRAGLFFALIRYTYIAMGLS